MGILVDLDFDFLKSAAGIAGNYIESHKYWLAGGAAFGAFYGTIPEKDRIEKLGDTRGRIDTSSLSGWKRGLAEGLNNFGAYGSDILLVSSCGIAAIQLHQYLLASIDVQPDRFVRLFYSISDKMFSLGLGAGAGTIVSSLFAKEKKPPGKIKKFMSKIKEGAAKIIYGNTDRVPAKTVEISTPVETYNEVISPTPSP